VDPEGRSLADEARQFIVAAKRATTGSPDLPVRAARVRAARRRFLPYVVAGGALACGYLSVVAAGRDNLATVFGTAITAGLLVGMAVGWLLLGRYQRRVERSEIGRRPVDLAIVLLTVPAYVAAGWTSALVGWAVAVILSRPTPQPELPNAWPLLIAASLVLYPVSYAFARRDAGRPDDLARALLAMHRELNEQPRSFVVVGEFLIGLAWCLGSLLALFGVVIGVQIVFASQLEGLAIPEQLALVFLVVWIGMTAVGTVWTVKRLGR
jgi:hypothetical protein